MRDIYGDAERDLQRCSDPDLAVANKQYFKSPFVFYGVSKKDINRIGSAIYRGNRIIDANDLKMDLEAVWRSDVHEMKTMAIVLASLFIRQVHPEWTRSIFKTWVSECQTWDHLDELCIRVIGRLLLRDDSLIEQICEWTDQKGRWVRRASLISHLPAIRCGKMHRDAIERACVILAPDKDFFIRKAIGWVLREIGEKNQDMGIEMIGGLGARLSMLSFREATRKLDKGGLEKVRGLLKGT